MLQVANQFEPRARIGHISILYQDTATYTDLEFWIHVQKLIINNKCNTCNTCNMPVFKVTNLDPTKIVAIKTENLFELKEQSRVKHYSLHNVACSKTKIFIYMGCESGITIFIRLVAIVRSFFTRSNIKNQQHFQLCALHREYRLYIVLN